MNMRLNELDAPTLEKALTSQLEASKRSFIGLPDRMLKDIQKAIAHRMKRLKGKPQKCAYVYAITEWQYLSHEILDSYYIMLNAPDLSSELADKWEELSRATMNKQIDALGETIRQAASLRELSKEIVTNTTSIF